MAGEGAKNALDILLRLAGVNTRGLSNAQKNKIATDMADAAEAPAKPLNVADFRAAEAAHVDRTPVDGDALMKAKIARDGMGPIGYLPPMPVGAATITTPQQGNSASIDGTIDPDRGKIPAVGGPADQNNNGIADYNELPTTNTDPATGKTVFTFDEDQFMRMINRFTTNLINPNSNIAGAPQTKWQTYDTEAQAYQAQAAEQQAKDQALAALAAMKNS